MSAFWKLPNNNYGSFLIYLAEIGKFGFVKCIRFIYFSNKDRESSIFPSFKNYLAGSLTYYFNNADEIGKVLFTFLFSTGTCGFT
jgi:hypothetical protein